MLLVPQVKSVNFQRYDVNFPLTVFSHLLFFTFVAWLNISVLRDECVELPVERPTNLFAACNSTVYWLAVYVPILSLTQITGAVEYARYISWPGGVGA